MFNKLPCHTSRIYLLTCTISHFTQDLGIPSQRDGFILTIIQLKSSALITVAPCFQSDTLNTSRSPTDDQKRNIHIGGLGNR